MDDDALDDLIHAAWSRGAGDTAAAAATRLSDLAKSHPEHAARFLVAAGEKTSQGGDEAAALEYYGLAVETAGTSRPMSAAT